MAVTVEVQAGRRRLIEYLLSPVMRALKVLTQMFERVQQDHNDLECRQHMLQAISILDD